MRPLTQYQDIHDRDAARTHQEFDAARDQDGAATPHSRTRRMIGSLRRVYREINDANAAVDRLNRPWVYQGRDGGGHRASVRRASN